MEDCEIIELYMERTETAISETDKKYGRLCRSVAANILCGPEDIAECINDTYLNLWNTIPPQIPVSLEAFLCRITRCLALKKYRYNTALKRNPEVRISFSELEDCIADIETTDFFSEAENIAGAINSFLRTLDYENKNVFLRRYWYFDSVSNIAIRFVMSESKVKSMLFRTRNKLRKYLMKEGIQI